MPWISFSRLAPAGECVFVGLEGHLTAGSAQTAWETRPEDGWFLDTRDLAGAWRPPTETPPAGRWIAKRHVSDAGGDLGPPVVVWQARGIPSGGRWQDVHPNEEWALLPPWPVSAHARIQALEPACAPFPAPG